MINHLTLRVSDFEESREFYKKALALLGYKLLKKAKDNLDYVAAGFGVVDEESHRDFWIKEDKNYGSDSSLSCLAFTADSKVMVDEFHEAAIAAGGKNNGAPGYRPQYHKGYYAAFVLDPDGNNIEAVFDEDW